MVRTALFQGVNPGSIPGGAAMDLLSKKCIPCEGGTKPFEPEQIKPYLDQVKGWNLVRAEKIFKEFKFKGFKEALAFANKVGALAEEEGHHPDFAILYNKVILNLWTHAIGGLSENDFIMAAKIDQIK
ncbi:MAG: Threonine synthase [Candidatus Giovannonibacteria bacterium GW2011_GWB1_45_9b]|uniref:Putative pterin-4-alpha-carbinolamine dehydratase n=4 Tax=Candidatus Giovannoniibacteriota TaxID=1752738 RepID=A0A0G1N6J3_9BACT|nr:MAG: Threonine synthase [Candidatus Giovannonibacteria bacterium GW2011_GWC2_44_8]KKU16131.1 MAG: Threonine synthase [Candidatus Giovannonibacteria bacterium GW2011_GWB1_45_9b]